MKYDVFEIRLKTKKATLKTSCFKQISQNVGNCIQIDFVAVKPLRKQT